MIGLSKEVTSWSEGLDVSAVDGEEGGGGRISG